MPHKWKFFKTARLAQVKMETGDDLANLADLDKKLWTVLAIPTDGLRFDKRTLELLDTDKDGRIRAPELIAAAEWLKARLKSLDSVFAPSDGEPALQFDAINQATPEGAQLFKSLKAIAAQSGKADSSSISLADITANADMFKGTAFNGDGVITENCAPNSEIADTIKLIGGATGTTPDRSGTAGITKDNIDAFFTAAEAHLAWLAKGEQDNSIMFLGENTNSAEAALAAVEEKIDAFFTPPEDMPLVTDAPDLPLPLTANIHPLWAEKFQAFAIAAAAPALGKNEVTSISRSDWRDIKAKFTPLRAWRSAKPSTMFDGVCKEKLAALVANGTIRSMLEDLVGKDLALAGDYDRIIDAERVIRYTANLGELIQNYVNQARLYNPATEAIYQTGTLYIESRACSLCFHVENEGAHSALATNSKCCVLYTKLTRPDSAPRNICAVITAGLTAPLYAGRNGLFIDRDGRDWDAVITKVVPAQVSLKEAFWAPWVKLFTTVAEQAKKFLSSKQDAATGQVGSITSDAVASPSAAPNGAALASSVAALGVGVGMMGAACAGLIGLVAGLPLWKVLAGICVVILAVSLPSVIITWFKLRERDLGVILNAGGWAVNRPLHFSLSLAKLFTRPAKLPACAAVTKDPYASHCRCKIIAAIILILAIAAATAWKTGLWPFNAPEAEVPQTAEPSPAVETAD